MTQVAPDCCPGVPMVRPVGRLRNALAPAFAIAVVLLMVVSGLGLLGSFGAPLSLGGSVKNTASGAAGSHPGTLASRSTGLAPAAQSPLVGPAPSSGRGLFFNNSPIPFAPTGTQACYPSYSTQCANDSYDPSINYTSTGKLAVAYTVYTNSTNCANISSYVHSAIGVAVSSNKGSSWSTPVLLGNKDCAHANQYASAYQPSLASLSNGTLVLAFIEYNLTSIYSLQWQTYFGSYGSNVAYAALVVTRSFDNGAHWTAPLVLNTSQNPLGNNHKAPTPERPWVSAWGQTVYVAWMNYTVAPFVNYPYGNGSSQVHLLVSTNGGASFGSKINIPNEISTYDHNESIGINPTTTVTPSGTLWLTYATNVSLNYQYPKGCTYCLYYVWTANVRVGSSTNNGTSFAWHDAAVGVPGFSSNYPAYRPYPLAGLMDGMFEPNPQVAVNPANAQVYVIWAGGLYEQHRSIYGYTYPSIDETIWFTNSSTGGATWHKPHAVTQAFLDNAGQVGYNPSIAVDSQGTIHVAATFLNESQAQCAYYYGYTNGYCKVYEVYLNSTDNGTRFSQPVYFSDNTTDNAAAPDGNYATAVAGGGTVFFAWAHQNSTASYYYLYPPFPNTARSAQVTVSEPFNGTGYSMTFVEKGLRSGTPWGVLVMGNLRQGVAPGSLSLSGVPKGENLTWNITSTSSGFGTRFFANQSINPPYTFSGTVPVKIFENYTEQILVNISSTPYIGACPFSYPCWNNTYGMEINYNITPAPNTIWVNVNASFTASVTPALYGYPFPCPSCTFSFLWLTFLSWTGTGAGSVNTTGMNISFKAAGPVNETANFRVNGNCMYTQGSSTFGPCSAFNQTLTFHETGLPANVRWNVTVQGSFGTVAIGNSTTSTLQITSNATLGIVNYTVWSIPDATTGKFWVGVGSPGSPVELPGDRVVNVAFTLESASAASFPIQFVENGLPNQTAWTLDVGSAAWGVESPSTQLTLPGGSYSIGAADVYETNGTSYYARSITVDPFVENSTNRTYSSVPVSVSFNGSAFVIINYVPEYWVTVTASAGGTAGPASQWVHQGGSLALTESSDAGFYFVGWSGSGAGSITTSSTNPTVHPGAPVTELATFAPNPPRLWNVTVDMLGLPPGEEVSFTLGNLTYTGGPTFNISKLPTGNYVYSIPYGYANASNLTRFVPISNTTSFAKTLSGELIIGSDGWVNITYQTQYFVTLQATGNGTITPSPGVSWWNAGTSVVLTAIPNAHYKLSQWTGTGTGSVASSTAYSITVVANGPIVETAQFVWRPNVPPATFWFKVTETGLPSGTSWSVAAGGTGAAGTGATLTVMGLNGTYLVAVGTVYTAAGVRWVASGSSLGNQSIVSNTTASVTFAEQVEVTITASSGGSVSPIGTEWVAVGTVISLSATPGSGQRFVSWNGSGTGQYTGVSGTGSVTANGPINETATFAPAYQQKTSGSTTSGQGLALGILAALAVVGLLVGLLLGRRRRPSAPEPMTPYSPGETEGQIASEETTMGPPEGGSGQEDGAAIYDEGVP